LTLWRLRGHAVHPDACIASGESGVSQPSFGSSLRPLCQHISQTTEESGRTTGNIQTASRTQPHTRLKRLRVRHSYLPWNTALSSPLCGQVRDRPGSTANWAGSRLQLRDSSDHAGTSRKCANFPPLR
jgi:hypothetical protein